MFVSFYFQNKFITDYGCNNLSHHFFLFDFYIEINMSDPICQLMEDIEGLCKRCYHLQKSNKDMYGKRVIVIERCHFVR